MNSNQENLQDTQKNSNIEMSKDMPVLTPSTDIYEEKDSIVIICDMPGVSDKSVEVSYEGDVISLVGWQETIDNIQDKQLVLKGYRKGVYKRSFTMLTDVNIANISAKMKDGVLKVVLPKSERVKPKKINVQVG